MSDIKAVLIKDGKPSGEILDVFVEIDVLNSIGCNVYNVINLIDKKSRKIIALIPLSGPTEPTQENWVDLVKGELDFRESSDGERFLETLLYSDYFPENFSVSGDDWIGHTVLNVTTTTPNSGFFILIPNRDSCTVLNYDLGGVEIDLSIYTDKLTLFSPKDSSNPKAVFREFTLKQPLSMEQIVTCYITHDFSSVVKRDLLVEHSSTDEVEWVKLGSLELILLKGKSNRIITFNKDPILQALSELATINPDVRLKDLLSEDEPEWNTSRFLFRLVKRFGN